MRDMQYDFQFIDNYDDATRFIARYAPAIKGMDDPDTLIKLCAEYVCVLEGLTHEVPDVDTFMSVARKYVSLDDFSAYGIACGLLLVPTSFLTGVYFNLLKALIDGQKVKFCHECGAYFYGLRKDAAYCSPTCQNRAKAKKYNAKKKAAADVPPCRIIGR